MVHQSRPVLRSGGARAAHASGGLAAADPQFLLGVVHVFLTVATLIASWRAIPMLERPCSPSARISLPCDDSIGSGPWKLGSLQQLREAREHRRSDVRGAVHPPHDLIHPSRNRIAPQVSIPGSDCLAPSSAVVPPRIRRSLVIDRCRVTGATGLAGSA